MNNPYCYLLVRTDMPSLGRGKALAHAHHAGSHLTWTLAVAPLLAGQEIPEDVMEWHRSGGGFGVCSAIGAPNEMDLGTLKAVLDAAQKLGQHSGLVVDGTYPHLVDEETLALLDASRFTMDPKRIRGGAITFRSEPTCGWILGDKAVLEVILGRFSLVPNE